MMVETLMSGTQGEKDHIVYKEEDGKHVRLDYENYFDTFVWTFSFFSCLVEIVGAT